MSCTRAEASEVVLGRTQAVTGAIIENEIMTAHVRVIVIPQININIPIRPIMVLKRRTWTWHANTTDTHCMAASPNKELARHGHDMPAPLAATAMAACFSHSVANLFQHTCFIQVQPQTRLLFPLLFQRFFCSRNRFWARHSPNLGTLFQDLLLPLAYY